ncbi:NAD(P)/FAD-dependent oxidoreductase [Halomontanus rarus]|uniref:NAD(P)/FAD-dependent oxidoreductase n=1 Tax=Halomontanus rarus TaxID=3034020 RepID=UPI003CE48E76
MTSGQTTAETTASTRDERIADVAVVGGGPAGCSAAVFTARAGLETVLLEHERSSLLKSAHLENYLGFPLGIQPNQFLELAREHVREAGCRYRRETVVDVWLEGERGDRGEGAGEGEAGPRETVPERLADRKRERERSHEPNRPTSGRSSSRPTAASAARRPNPAATAPPACSSRRGLTRTFSRGSPSPANRKNRGR